MIDELLPQVTKHLSNGLNLSQACDACDIGLFWFVTQLDAHPKKRMITASLRIAEGDGCTKKADKLRERLSHRIDHGLVRSRSVAAVEQAKIKRLQGVAERLRSIGENLILKDDHKGVKPRPQNRPHLWTQRILDEC